MTTESPEVRAAAERRAGWRESCNYPDYPARSPYGDDGGSGRERIQDAMNLADAYLAIRAELARLRDERGDGWRPISTAPKDGKFMVLIAGMWWPAYRGGGYVYSNAHGRINDPDDRYSIAVEWWRPMPPAPTGITLDAAEGK